MIRDIRYLSFLVILVVVIGAPTPANAAVVIGKIRYITNSVSGNDNFRIILKPGWSRDGCTGGNTSSEVSIYVYPSVVLPIENFNRTYTIANTAMVNNKLVRIHSNSSSCSGNLTRIAVEK